MGRKRSARHGGVEHKKDKEERGGKEVGERVRKGGGRKRRVEEKGEERNEGEREERRKREK